MLVAAVAFGARADADPQGSILHEFIPPDPNEDVSFAATTLDGDLPAAIQTPSGVATAPDPRKPPVESHVYGGTTSDDSPDSTYEPDRDTRRPNVENYDDPFSPSTAPFKRLRAYDAVDEDYSLRVRDKTLRPVPVGGTVRAGDEPFYGDLSVDLLPDLPVRIPTVGPGARLLRMHANPEVPVQILRDGADNWFARSSARARVHLVLELAIPRAAFGSAFADVEWSELDRALGQHAGHQAAVSEVAQAIGVSRQMRARDVVKKLVAYYRAFQPSDDPPRGRQDIFLDLALSKKGVCRHRAFAFLVTALGLGIPTRMVVNEAHAWVEVSDGRIWHRIDLGGAAANLDFTPDKTRPAYVPPPDPYGWPEGRDGGQDLVDRAKKQDEEQEKQRTESDANAAPSSSASASASAPSPSATPSASSSGEPEPPKIPPSELSVAAIDSDVRRGVPLHIQGVVQSGGAACAHVRVDVVLTGPAVLSGAVVGSLSTDEAGKYDGAIVIPRDFALGDYELSVSTPGDARCGPGKSK
ncbi:MAG TPA: transglutaminase-like domain-containing protein [Minicystis sp.]|nr:transglutaminase-like domain-containing protein [Minicystis sp.]